MPPSLPPHGEPTRALTPRQEEVVNLLPFGLSLAEIGRRMGGIGEKAVRDHVNAIAMLLPNDGGLPAEKLVRAWAGWRYWRKHFAKFPAIASDGPPITTGEHARP